jgi:Heme NO binding associated
MDTKPVQLNCQIPLEGLSRFMPMHLILDRDDRVVSLGPTLARVLSEPDAINARFHDLFEVRSPGGATTVAELLDRAGDRFRLVVRKGSRIGLRGLGMRLAGGDLVLINLSFGDRPHCRSTRVRAVGRRFCGDRTGNGIAVSCRSECRGDARTSRPEPAA